MKGSKWSSLVKSHCKLCGVEMTTRIAKIEHGKNLYCSIVCRNKFAEQRRLLKPIGYEKYLIEKVRRNKRCAKCAVLIFRRATYCKKHRKVATGERNSAWRGGISTANARARSSVNYREWRRKVLKRDGYKCIICKSKSKLEADHIYPFSLYSELRFKVGNGRILCRECHKKTDTYLKSYKQLLNIVKLPNKWDCDLCGGEFLKPMDVRNEVLVLNGIFTRCCAYVCDDCIKKVVAVLDDNFPNSTYMKNRASVQTQVVMV